MALFRNLINKFSLITKPHFVQNQILQKNLNLIPRCYNSTIPTPYEIVDNKEAENENKGIFLTKCI